MACDKLKDKKYERFNYYQHVYCEKCGHSMFFLTNHPMACNNCGTLVYPSKRIEFKEKLNTELRKRRNK